ncbi:T9SS type A sorting domain-containing protein [uncultured Polaribacter sp.]|uniref:T9SS type A sorting domain-containing protein n=1 Tax=uncultured Polaribacter sp. TaxID=174711 RepID=UPI002605CEFB|nr:T9SS type A sorting domain-containing protein [uncultured Polaribacter sp.]
MKRKLLIPCFAVVAITMISFYYSNKNNSSSFINKEEKLKTTKKTESTRQLYAIEREKHELEMQKNPLTGVVPLEEKEKELAVSLELKKKKELQRATISTYTSRGPSNLGGRTRAFALDLSDPTSKTMLSGGVSSGLFRTTDGGANWTKVTTQGQIHNVSALAQDPRTGFQNIWYYGTGEWSGNSASLGSSYRGQGIWKSTDNGLTWSILSGTDSDQTVFDTPFDYTNALEVHPVTGELFIASTQNIYRYDGTTFHIELSNDTQDFSDLVISDAGKVYASFDGGTTLEGVWLSPTGTGSWTQIAKNGTPTDWAATGRIVLGDAPSEEGMIYALYVNGNSGGKEADLWQFNPTLNTWVNFSSKLPDEAGGDSAGNDPIAVQGGYDLVVSVKPDDENFVVIGGTNAYKIENINTDPTFLRIGGYASNSGYAQYSNHHPDIHDLTFDPNNYSTLFSGTDGGVHKTTDISANPIVWESLNNNYITYQYYHVALDPLSGSNIVLGGAQDNGTTVGGTDAGLADNKTMNSVFGGDGVAVGLARRNTATGSALQYFLGSQQGNIYTNYPSGLRNIKPTGSPSGNSAQFVTYFYVDPDNNDLLYYAGNNDLYRTNASETVTSADWVNAGSLPTNENLRTFATTRGNYNDFTSFLLVGGNSGGVFKVVNPKNTSSIGNAVNITPSGATTTNNTIVSGIAIHPTNPDIVLVTYANYGIQSIFLSNDATSASPTWTLVERNLSAHSIRSAAIAQVGAETVYYVGTARGLYSSLDPTTTDWEMEGASEIGLSLISGLVYRPSDNKLLIGTHGNGMFETTVESTLSTKNFNTNNLEVSFYPNPTQKTLNLQSNSLDLSKNVTYTISDITGKIAKKGTLNAQKINVETLNNGIYIVQLIAEGKNQSFKFIKN